MAAAGNGSALRPGFPVPVADSQQVFRRVLRAMSEPGSLQDIAVDLDPPAPLDRATAALCLTLLDFERRSGWTRQRIAGTCGPGFASIAAARSWSRRTPRASPLWPLRRRCRRLARSRSAREAYPDESATVILQVPSLDRARRLRFAAGDRDCREFCAAGIAGGFWKQRREMEALFRRAWTWCSHRAQALRPCRGLHR